MTTAPTTPESILSRFAAAYAEHGAGNERRLQIGYGGVIQDGFIVAHDGSFSVCSASNGARPIRTKHITRIDYSNARYRGTEPLWQREG